MINREDIFYKNRFIQIFRDHWDRFKEFHPEYISEVVEENVEKIIG